MNIKKFTKKDRHGNMMSFEFDTPEASANIPPMNMIPQYNAVGGMTANHPGEPKGSDTVPAWLTPGEFVVNKEAVDIYGPQIKKMNDVGREIQDGDMSPTQAPPIYAKKGGDTSWITGDLISNLGLIESSNKHFDPSTKSGLVESYGKGDNKAYGKYQWTVPAARSPGFGVKGFDPREVTEEVMREKTIDYLMGIQRHYPDWTPEQVLRAYNQGPGKTREMITGKWENDPRSKDYGKDILNPDGTKTFRGFGRDTKYDGLWGGITAEARDYPFKVLSGSQDARMPVPLPSLRPEQKVEIPEVNPSSGSFLSR